MEKRVFKISQTTKVFEKNTCGLRDSQTTQFGQRHSCLTIYKSKFSDFLNSIKTSFELIAPVKTDVVRYEKIDDIDKIYLEKNSYFPIKEYFFRKQETLFQFDGTKFVEPKLKTPKRAFFGVRRCDLNAILHQDSVFKEVNDVYYLEARKNTLLLGYHCNEAPSQYCFCGSLDLLDFFDIMFYDKGNYYLAEIGSDKGKKIVSQFSSLFSLTDIEISHKDKIIPGASRLIDADISGLYNNKDWKKGVNQCLSCGACTALCPTCYCFEIQDDIQLNDIKKSTRKRVWSSCQIQEFTRVAGDHVFRQDREERFKHRIYHQLDYFKQKNNVNLCVGCGRCIEGCPTRIDFVEIINGMKTN